MKRMKEYLLRKSGHRWAATPAVLIVIFCQMTASAQETPSAPDTPRYSPAPDPQRVFRLESQAELIERMIRGSKTGENPLNLKYDFLYPDYPAPSKESFALRQWAPLTEMIEPPYVCYHRLYFEQINAERYGWDLGIGHPLLSAGIFYLDVALLPYHVFTEPLRRYECNAGYCLPGDPVPLMLYPPNLNVPGILAEAAAVGLCFVIFP
jgi:hypothetical protein